MKKQIATKNVFYTLRIRCNNCQHYGTVSIPQGTLIAEAKCPNCGCHGTMKKAV